MYVSGARLAVQEGGRREGRKARIVRVEERERERELPYLLSLFITELGAFCLYLSL